MTASRRLAGEADEPGMDEPEFTGTVLLVEDNSIIALDAECMLQDLGFAAVEIATTNSQAIEALSRLPIRVAVLDVNLGNESSAPIAELLHARGVPFAIATGYGSSRHLPQQLTHAPIIAKPYTAAGLAAALRAALGIRER